MKVNKKIIYVFISIIICFNLEVHFLFITSCNNNQSKRRAFALEVRYKYESEKWKPLFHTKTNTLSWPKKLVLQFPSSKKNPPSHFQFIHYKWRDKSSFWSFSVPLFQIPRFWLLLNNCICWDVSPQQKVELFPSSWSLFFELPL